MKQEEEAAPSPDGTADWSSSNCPKRLWEFSLEQLRTGVTGAQRERNFRITSGFIQTSLTYWVTAPETDYHDVPDWNMNLG
uniref:Uncharacterized protein n=1 Tax=Knipowitschia caucasica TaxID=637954 RepID=A0AAV2LSF8_KNICA